MRYLIEMDVTVPDVENGASIIEALAREFIANGLPAPETGFSTLSIDGNLVSVRVELL